MIYYSVVSEHHLAQGTVVFPMFRGLSLCNSSISMSCARVPWVSFTLNMCRCNPVIQEAVKSPEAHIVPKVLLSCSRK